MQRLIPYGICNFEKLIKENYYFVDKTEYIEKLEKVDTPVFLRPRRFGKSLFTEMLKWYYDIKAKDRFEELFGDLYIGKNPTGNQNKYLFLTLDFSGIDVGSENNSLEYVRNNFSNKIHVSFLGFLRNYQKELGISKNIFSEFSLFFNKSMQSALEFLFEIVENSGHKMFITIDEYDSFTNALAVQYMHAEENDSGYYKILSKGGFFRSFFESLKDGLKTAVDKIYITGILPITISDMNSGFNVAKWITNEPEFDNMLGITESEMERLVDEVLSDYPDIRVTKAQIFEKLRIYANNYRFSTGSEPVFNTTISLHILDAIISRKVFPRDFIDGNIRVQYNQISYIFGKNYRERDKILEKLTNFQSLDFQLEEKKLFDLNDYRSGNYIKDCLYYHGLITNTEFENEFTIPNLVSYEMLLSYFERIKGFDIDESQSYDYIFEFTDTGDIKYLVEQFFKNVIKRFPGDFFANANESFYHGLFFHVLYNSLGKNRYEILPEFNVPGGQVDVMFRTLPGAKVRAEFQVFAEIKQVPKRAEDSELKAKLKESVEQVKKYRTGDYSNYTGLAVAFRGNKDYLMDVL